MGEQLSFDFDEQATPSAESLAQTYIKIREAREEVAKEFDEKDQELKEQQDVIKRSILDLCKTIGADSIKTKFGTISRSTKVRYHTTNWDGFRKFVVDTNMPELLEKRIHQGNMKQLIEESPEMLPEGVNTMSEYTISVRRTK
jgi:hypothetical protein|tara:strand:+ start:625 stop:1053 length:429 start_codon:yes stop_codon:yes gene_type:complete